MGFPLFRSADTHYPGWFCATPCQRVLCEFLGYVDFPTWWTSVQLLHVCLIHLPFVLELNETENFP